MKKFILGLFASASMAGAATFTENFATDPAARGWQTLGDTNLFHWNSTNQNMEVTWDSAQTNSYFCHSLGTTLTSRDNFSLAFDLELSDATISGYGFEIAIGLLNLADATGPNFLRGTGYNSPNLIEFDYFPDAGYGPSIDASMADTNSNFQFLYDSLPLVNGTQYHVMITHIAGAPFVSAEVLGNGNFYSALPSSYPSTNFTDFTVDTISISSYSGAQSGGGILAHGTLDNVVMISPLPVVEVTGNLMGRSWQVQFASATNWVYVLERTVDLQSWTAVSPALNGTGTALSLQDTNAPAGSAFYRVRAALP